jgi:hypothetical protein
MMEQHAFLKITLEDRVNGFESHRTLIERYGRETLSYAAVTDWRREFHAGRQDVEDNQRPRRPTDFGIHLRVEQTFTAVPNDSVRSIAEITVCEPSTVFYLLTQVLDLTFRTWRWVTHSLSDAQQVGPLDGFKLLRAELLAAKRRNWKFFSTGNESWILWNTQQSGSWLAVDQKLPVRTKQTISTPKSMATVFFNPHSFAVFDLLPENESFISVSFIDHVLPNHSFGFTRVRQRITRVASSSSILTVLPAEESDTPLTPPISPSVTAIYSGLKNPPGDDRLFRQTCFSHLVTLPSKNQKEPLWNP